MSCTTVGGVILNFRLQNPGMRKAFKLKILTIANDPSEPKSLGLLSAQEGSEAVVRNLESTGKYWLFRGACDQQSECRDSAMIVAKRLPFLGHISLGNRPIKNWMITPSVSYRNLFYHEPTVFSEYIL